MINETIRGTLNNMLNEKNEPLVSIIMNCFNGEKYLKEAIDSGYAQTYRNWEIIFWDNASTDQSAAIAKSYDEKIRYFHGTVNIPLGAARNKAMEQARGEFIAFLDCDDIWFSDKLEKQINIMNQGDYGLCYGGVLNIDSEGKELEKCTLKFRNGNLFETLLKQFDVNLPTALIRASAVKQSNLVFDGNVTASEEYCLFMQLAVEHNFCSMSDILAKYRIHDGALTSKSISKWAEEREYTLNIICNKHPGIREKYPTSFKEAFARAVYYRARYYMFLKNRKRAIKEMASVSFASTRYFKLFLITLLPIVVWNIIHKKKSKRNL